MEDKNNDFENKNKEDSNLENNDEELKEHKNNNISENENKEKSESDNDENSIQDEGSYEKLEEEIKSLKEEKIRLLAESENVRKRFEREKIDSIKFGSMNLARDILSLDDNLQRALSAISEKEKYSQSITNLIDGLKMVRKEFFSILEKNGVKKINSLDSKFDPNIHQAMIEIENADIDEGLVVQEMQSGYLMYDRLLRPAMVGVSKKPPLKNNKNNDKKNKQNKDK